MEESVDPEDIRFKKGYLRKLEQRDANEIMRFDRMTCGDIVRMKDKMPSHMLVQKLHEIQSARPFGYSDELLALELAEWIKGNEPVFPNYGIYVYYHPYEGYKIGQAENVMRRMSKHECSAPSSELLHVIETSDLDWCEGFLHGKFQRQRKFANHEYFDLSRYDLHWLFSIKVLERPKSIANQMSLLDLL